ncbi:MAG: hypothetical protein AABZ60_19520 [Planctomycetota bacterium]
MDRCIGYLFFLGFLLFSVRAQPAEFSLQLPESWCLEKDLEKFYLDTNTLQETMIRLEQLNQNLQNTLKSLTQTPNSLELSRANKDLSLSIDSFHQQTEQLIQSYEWLAEQHQQLETRLFDYLKKIEEEQTRSYQKIIRLRRELLKLQSKEQAVLDDYRWTKNIQTRTYLKQLFLLDCKNCESKQFLLEQQEKKFQKIQQFQSQFLELSKVFQPMKDSFRQLIQSLQEEKIYLLDLARFQIGMLQNDALFSQIQQGRHKIHTLEKSLSIQLETYSQTRDQLEEQMSRIRQDFSSQSQEQSFSKSDTLNFVSPK